MDTKTKITVRHEGVKAVWNHGPYADILMATAGDPTIHCVDCLDATGYTGREDIKADLIEWVRDEYATYYENA